MVHSPTEIEGICLRPGDKYTFEIPGERIAKMDMAKLHYCGDYPGDRLVIHTWEEQDV